MKVHISRVSLSPEELTNPVIKKWGVNGKVAFSSNWQTARITVAAQGKLHSDVTDGCLLHERGHVEYFEDLLAAGLDFAETGDNNIWHQEVDAWLRGLPVPFTLATGQFALDCLWTYKVGYNVSADDWTEAKVALSKTCRDPEAFMDYVPLPVPPGTPPPEPSYTIEEAPADEDEPDDEHGEDGAPNPDNERPMSERDEWLLSAEALPFLTKGRSDFLMMALRERSFVAEAPLPPVAAAIFKRAGGIWKW